MLWPHGLVTRTPLPTCGCGDLSSPGRQGLSGGQFAFASTERLGKYLGVVPGSVSPLAIINDHGGAVQVFFQHTLLKHEWIYLHPCRNTHSTRIRTADLLRLLEHWNHPVTQIDFESDID